MSEAVAQVPAVDSPPAASTSVDICVCTFRRPHLALTLGSIAAIDATGAQIRVLVADNDAVASAASLVEAQRAGFPFSLLYLHVPSANISLARNSCLEHADADFVAFVDDDELVSPGWLKALLDTARQSQADAVLGPVRALYEPSVPAWQRVGDFHSTLPVQTGGGIRTGYTCNVLLRCTAAVKPMRFDLGLGQTGGEDTEFFYRLTDAGGHIAFAPEAWVYEPVPASRTGLGWLVRRRFRSGQTYGARLLATGENRPRAVALASAKAALCLGLTLATAWSPIAWRKNLLRGVLHLGVVGGLFGTRQARHYGA
ncbi:glycosyltransferase [Devosia sp. 1566]|uniref:glycosyltransferase family 2 protein n=1 Tax=Devosia sp. 1566 TaxID=2499144 RepID=UPI000FDBA3D6|nr:glycosyltransferase [Devosia sp. 1566]